MTGTLPSIENVREATARIFHHAHRTPVVTSRSIDAITGASLFFKCENLQRVGAFKFRGACNAVLSLSEDEARRGVATHSSGNHAAALALAASIRGIDAHIVMPRTSPGVKKAAVAAYGGRITMCDPGLSARESTLAGILESTGATFLHPYNDPRVIAGQGTAALELLEDIPDLDIVMTPIGGGGLMSGTSIAVKAGSPRTRLVGAEPEGADDARRSLEQGRIVPSVDPRTIADGLLTQLGSLTFPIISANVERIVTASDAMILAAMRLLLERTKMLVEPSGCVPLAAIMQGSLDVQGARVGIILTGGNVDPALLASWLVPPGKPRT